MQEREGEVFRLECFPVNFAIVQIMVTACRFVLCLFDLFLFTFLTGTRTPPTHTHNQHNRLQTLPTQQPHHFMSTTTASAAGSASADASGGGGGGANLSLHTPSLVGLFVASCMHHVLCVDACRGPRWNTAKSDFIPFH
jgi:hypothetical protein